MSEKTVQEQPRRTLEEDDEFEDFPADTWGQEETLKETKTLNLWEEDWDDVEVEDDFTTELKAELEKHRQSA
ncbi:SEM1 (YDR363W-A) [Zygosaccharomyces parabailii]|nr:SEM1 (YDR363W-A) [Zygosaccharomyces parabailii]